MRSLDTERIEDWGDFIEKHDVNFTCRECEGEGCEECEEGSIFPMWNTVWDTGFFVSDHHHLPCKPAPNVVAFQHGDHVWLGLTGCGMDCTPYLALAWLNLFPDCRWVPENFLVTGYNLTEGYIETCLGTEDARRIYEVMDTGMRGSIQSDIRVLKDIRATKRLLEEKVGAENGG